VLNPAYGPEPRCYWEFRWVGITELMPELTGGETPLVVSNDPVVVEGNGETIAMTRNAAAISNQRQVDSAGNYSVQVGSAAQTSGVSSVASTNKGTGKAAFVLDRSGPSLMKTLTYIDTGHVKVTVTAKDPAGVTVLSWRSGAQTLANMRNSGTAFTGSFTASNSGQVTLYAKDRFGYETLQTVPVYCHRVLFNLNYTAAPAPARQTIVHNGLATRPANPVRTGWVFTGWYPTTACTGTAWNFTGTKIMSNLTLYARWTVNKPATYNAVSTSYNSVKVSWSSVPNASGYEVYGARYGSTPIWLSTLPATATSRIQSGLVTGTLYQFKVRAFQLSGTSRIYGAFTSLKSVRPMPTVPKNLAVVRYSTSSIKTSWQAVSGASGYEIYRATSLAGPYEIIARVRTTGITSWLDTSLRKGTTYYYKVRAFTSVRLVMYNGAFTAVRSATP
jgi:uncharacterized repeat protein (TIGR02543 family)